MFKEYSSQSMSKEQVIAELEKISNLGWDVFQKGDKSYIIKIDEHKEIEIRKSDEKWFIVSYVDGLPKFTVYSNSIETLHEHLIAAAKKIEINLNIEKVNNSIRIIKDEPFSNKVKLLTLIGNSKISKIFDPYFDLKSLITLKALDDFGAKIDNKLDCLTTKDLTLFNQTIIDDFNDEFKTKIEIKKCDGKEHRRFLILDDNRVIMIGCSLNDINKNEAVIEEINQELKNDDLKFFNEKWIKL